MRPEAKIDFARSLRRDETFAEKRLWEQLRGRKLGGLKFVRQAAIGPYVVDFLCREHRFIIEVDGATHSTERELEKDAERTSHLAELGHRIVRFQNEEILHGLDGVLVRIREALAS